MKKNSNILFKVKILLYEGAEENEFFCLGSDDVDAYVKERIEYLGLEMYKGYRTQAIDISSHVKKVIEKGMS